MVLRKENTDYEIKNSAAYLTYTGDLQTGT